MSKEPVTGAKASPRSNAAAGKSKKSQTRRASAEAEAMRLKLLAEVGEVTTGPGQLDALLDRAYLADSFFEEHVLQDPACLGSPALFREAWAVARALADFYQKVGEAVARQPVACAAAGNADGAKP